MSRAFCLPLPKRTTVRYLKWAPLLAGLVGMATAPARAETQGYVIASFMTSVYTDQNTCPEGLNEGPDNKDAISRIPDPELRDKLHKALPETLTSLMTHRGPNWADVCHLEAAVSNPDVAAGPLSVPDPGMKLVEGKTSYGLNLDGTKDGAPTQNTCRHAKFTGPKGEAGVDNQLYRVLGCTVGFGPQGWFRIYGQQQMRDGDRSILVKVSGIEDPRNSSQITVDIADGADAMIKDPKGNILTDVTYHEVNDSRRHATTHGRIVNGVLTTDPVDLTVLRIRFTGAQIPSTIHGARLRVELQPDGTAKGVLAGYQNWQDIYRLLVHTGANDELPLFFTCPAVYRAFQREADGGKDPETGTCADISVSYDVELVPAHIAPPVPSNAAPIESELRTASPDVAAIQSR